MVLLGLLLAVAALFLFALVELRRAPPEGTPAPPEPHLARGLVRAFVAGLVLAPLSPAWLAVTNSATPLPVARPDTPEGGAWSFDFDFGPQFWVFVVGGFLLVRLGPVLVAFLIGRRRTAAVRPLPTGRRLALAAGLLAAAVAVLAAARVAWGGASLDDFGTYGALTPDKGSSGDRIDRVLDRRIAESAILQPPAPGEPLETEVTLGGASSDNYMAIALDALTTHEVPGLKAWVADRPVLFERQKDGSLAARPVADRQPGDFPPARRPHFRTMPRWAEGAEPGSYVLVEERPDELCFVVRMDETGAVPTMVNDVGLLLAVSAWPMLGLLCAIFLAIGLTRRAAAGSPWGAPLRFGAAWLLLESAVAVALMYWPYV
jgi:hypothetical protein